MDKRKKKWKNQCKVIVNNEAKTTRPITLQVLKLKLKRGRKKKMQI